MSWKELEEAQRQRQATQAAQRRQAEEKRKATERAEAERDKVQEQKAIELNEKYGSQVRNLLCQVANATGEGFKIWTRSNAGGKMTFVNGSDVVISAEEKAGGGDLYDKEFTVTIKENGSFLVNSAAGEQEARSLLELQDALVDAYKAGPKASLSYSSDGGWNSMAKW